MTFSISTQNSGKLDQIGFNFPPDLSLQFTYSSIIRTLEAVEGNFR